MKERIFAWPLVLVLCAMARVDTYTVVIDKGAVPDAGPDTFVSSVAVCEGTPLLTWLGGPSNIDKILVGTPAMNPGQQDFSEDLLRRRFQASRCVDSQKDLWHYAPYTMGVVYLKSRRKIKFQMYLSGIMVGGHLFASRK